MIGQTWFGARSTLRGVALRARTGATRCWRSDAATLERDLSEPARSRCVPAARLRCVCCVCAAPSPRSDSLLTSPALVFCAGIIHSSTCRTSTIVGTKHSNLVYDDVRGGRGRSDGVGALSGRSVRVALRRRVERPLWPAARPVWAGGRVWAAGEPVLGRPSGAAGCVCDRARRTHRTSAPVVVSSK